MVESAGLYMQYLICGHELFVIHTTTHTQASRPLQLGEQLLQAEMEDFEQQCIKKVRNKKVVFGPQELEEG